MIVRTIWACLWFVGQMVALYLSALFFADAAAQVRFFLTTMPLFIVAGILISHEYPHSRVGGSIAWIFPAYVAFQAVAAGTPRSSWTETSGSGEGLVYGFVLAPFVATMSYSAGVLGELLYRHLWPSSPETVTNSEAPPTERFNELKSNDDGAL